MKVKSIRLENILSHKESAFTFDGLTVFRGDNGAGKSTLVASVQETLTGICQHTDARGAGAQFLLRSGEDKGYIDVGLIDEGELYTVSNSITEKSGRTQKCVKASDPTAKCTDYLAHLAMHKEVLGCLLNGRYFFSKNEKEQQKMLAAIIVPKQYEFESWVWSAMSDCGLQVDRSQSACDQIAAAYKAAYDGRRDVNRDLANWTEPERIEAPKMSAADIRARLQERQQERTKWAIDRGRITAAHEAKIAERRDLDARLSRIACKLDTDRQRRKEVDKAILSKSAIKEHEKIVGNAKRAAELSGLIATNATELRLARKASADFNDAFEKGKCVSCTRPIPEDIGLEIAGQLAQRVIDLQEKDNRMQQELKGLGDYEGAQKNLDAHRQAETQLKTIDAHIADGEKETREIETKMQEPLPNTPDTAEIDAKIADLDKRIEEGNGRLQLAVRAETLQATHSAAMENKAKLEATQATLQKLVDYFDPGKSTGVLAKLLAQSVRPFQEKMNAALDRWGFRCVLNFEPYAFDVGFTSTSHKLFPLQTISASQRAAFQVAFQVALAKTTGFNFVWVDAADIWLDDRRRALYKILMASGLDQVVVLQSDLRREIPPAKDARFYMLRLEESSDDVPRTKAEVLS